jgi:hypothetical protein
MRRIEYNYDEIQVKLIEQIMKPNNEIVSHVERTNYIKTEKDNPQFK